MDNLWEYGGNDLKPSYGRNLLVRKISVKYLAEYTINPDFSQLPNTALITKQHLLDYGGGGGGTWGSITGTLSNQTDLDSALGNKVDKNLTIVPATKTKITYDSKGLVTNGDDVTPADIVGLADTVDLWDSLYSILMINNLGINF